ncbi:MAG: hypothetical protein RIS47_1938 [Bacteroidota bacterium]|jgi:hypothetical protein
MNKKTTKLSVITPNDPKKDKNNKQITQFTHKNLPLTLQSANQTEKK